jgi:hypothetical protein
MEEQIMNRLQSSAGAIGLAAMALAATTNAALAQSTAKRRPAPASMTAAPVALVSDLVAAYTPPSGFVESYSESHPCTPHSHTHTTVVRVKRRQIGTLPAPQATLYKDNQPIYTWTLPGTPGTGDVVLGTLAVTKPHPCPGGGTTVTVGPPPPPPNYRLVVDPGNLWQEASETNNVVVFYVDPAAPLVPAS